MSRTRWIAVVAAVLVLGVFGLAWLLGGKQASKISGVASDAPGGPASPGNGGTKSVPTPKTPANPVKPGGWQPPEGDPVERYREGKTAQARRDMISNFMALGHDRNPDMLIEALKDPDTDVRVFAVESASALTPEEAVRVYMKSASNENPDVREMTWSLVAPHPMENRVLVYREALSNGSTKAMEEALSEMGTTPERPLFEMMLEQANKQQGDRAKRLTTELNEWLKPGGGNVPEFTRADELAKWWSQNSKNYDEYMLRVDL